MNGRTNSTKDGDTIINGALIPLEPATNFTIASGSNRSYFNWTDPVDKYTTPGDELVSEWAKTIVTRKENSAPTSPDDGTVVLTELVRNQYAIETYSDENLENDKLYYYSIFPITTYNVHSVPVHQSVIPLGGELEYKTVIDTPFYLSTGDPTHMIEAYASSVNSAGAYFIHYDDDRSNRRNTANVGAINSDLTCSQIYIGYFSPLDNEISSASIGEKYAVFGRNWERSDTELEYDWPIICINESMTVQSITGLGDANVLGVGESINDILLYGDFTSCLGRTINSDLTTGTRDSVGYEIPAAGRNNKYIIALDTTVHAIDKDLTNQQLGNSSFPDINSYMCGSTKVDKYVTFGIYANVASRVAIEAYDDDLVQTPYTSIEIPNVSDDTLQFAINSSRYVHNTQVGSYGVMPITFGISDDMWPIGSNPAYLRIDKDLIVSFKSISDYVIDRETRNAWRGQLIVIYGNMLFTYVHNTYNEADIDNPFDGYLMVLETN